MAAIIGDAHGGRQRINEATGMSREEVARQEILGREEWPRLWAVIDEAVIDSKAPDGAKLTVSRRAWRAFLMAHAPGA